MFCSLSVSKYSHNLYFQDVLNNSNMTDKEAFAFLKENLSDEAKAAIDQLDVDQDGKVSYPEFLLVMKFKK